VRATLERVRRWGLFGTLGQVWRATGGRLADVTLVHVWVMDTREASLLPAEGYTLARLRAGADRDPRVEAAARLLRVRADQRLGQDVFVALEDGQVVACMWNDPPAGPVCAARGLTVEASHRRRGVAAAVVMHQAVELRGDGVEKVTYRIAFANRASNRLFHRLRVAVLERPILVAHVLGRGRELRAPALLDRWMRRLWERERRAVLAEDA
jgi:GNAT superfamily N-acetyltransferase